MDKKHYCTECDENRSFRKVYVEETMPVKGIEITNTHEYWKCEGCEELFEPFNEPDKNLLSDYAIYKEKMSLLQTYEIVKIRNKYGLSLRNFATILGVSYSTLSNIENGAIQSRAHDTTLFLASDPYAFKMQAVRVKSLLKNDIYNELLTRLDRLVINSYSEHNKIASRALDVQNELLRRSNLVEINKEINVKSTGGEVQWRDRSNTINLSWET